MTNHLETFLNSKSTLQKGEFLNSLDGDDSEMQVALQEAWLNGPRTAVEALLSRDIRATNPTDVNTAA